MRTTFLLLLFTGLALAGEDQLLEKLRRHHAYTASHVTRVGEYAAYLAGQTGASKAQVEVARHGGRLHDLGKLSVPVALLDKQGKLSEAEWLTVKAHPLDGARIAKEDGVATEWVEAIAGHHERWDGKGYPGGVTHEKIPWAARVVAVADTWDAVTTNRSYQKARSFDEAQKVLRDAAGSQLDPALVDAFLRDRAALDKLRASLDAR